MTKKEFLNQYLDAKACISQKLERMENLRELAFKSTSFISGAQAKGACNASFSEIIDAVADMESEVEKDIEILRENKGQVMQAIYGVPSPIYRKVLGRRYINGEDWADIASALGYSKRHVTRIHARALDEVDVPQ